MDPGQAFEREVADNIEKLRTAPEWHRRALDWMTSVADAKYSYNFSWLGRPIIQYPQDMVALQELIWRVRPDCIVETGIAHGGSLILSASMLALLDYADAVTERRPLDPRSSTRRVIAVDIDIRQHNRAAIEAHPFSHLIEMIQGSSIESSTIDQVKQRVGKRQRVLVSLDSNHTHDHVLAELKAYAPLVATGSYCVVFDTLVEDVPSALIGDRPWGKGNSPKSAVWAFLEELKKQPLSASDGLPLAFEVDRALEAKLQITVAPDGFLRRV